MPKFRFDGDAPRVYPHLSLVVEPGDVVDLADAPADGRFSPVTVKKTAHKEN